MTRPYQRLHREWDDRGGTIELDESQIAQIEERYGIRFPEEFREYLLHACPKNDWCMDDNGTDWWTSERIRNVVEECLQPDQLWGPRIMSDPIIEALAPKTLFFADYYLWCMAWAIVCEPGEYYGRIVVFNADERFVADSFGDFVDRYMAGDIGELL